MEKELFIAKVDYNDNGKRNNAVTVNLNLKEGDVFSTSQDISIRSSIPGSVVELKRVSMPNGKIEDVAVVKMQGAFSYEGKKNIKSEWTLFSSSKILSRLSLFIILVVPIEVKNAKNNE